MEGEEKEEFILFMQRKTLSERTQKDYLLYYRKLQMILSSTCRQMDQEILNSFLDLYSHRVARAMLKNYLEFKDLNLKIQKRTGHVEYKEVEQIPSDDIPKIRQKLYDRGKRFGLLFDLTLACALRRQEVLNIRARDISTAEVDGKTCMYILLKKTKGNKQRQVFVPESVAIDIVLFMTENNYSKADFLFRSTKNFNRHIETTQWNKEFSKASLEATGKRFHPHQLRHKMGTTWYEKGVDIVQIQHRLGHSSIATTMLYINPDKKKELENWSREGE